MEESRINASICPRCGKKLPEFNEQWKHNFCPTLEDSKTVSICMTCKMKEVFLSWK